MTTYSRKEIFGTTPLDLKNINDNFKWLWLKTFGNMVDADISDDANINGAKLKAQSVTAEQIDVTSLYVGTGGIRLDASATISWGQVTSQPEIIDENTVTTISRNEISTATINANQINGGTISGCTLQTASVNNRYLACSEQYIDFFANSTLKMEIGFYNGAGDNTPSIKMWEGTTNGNISTGVASMDIYANKSISINATYNGGSGGIYLAGSALTFNTNPVLTTASTVTVKFA